MVREGFDVIGFRRWTGFPGTGSLDRHGRDGEEARGVAAGGGRGGSGEAR